ncbi:hypothetical protein [Zemynaea arenosa]|uniref:hypothetical protein n=1 Tax=Zemynaea arenosa TaxID=2561931 RepID=UPI001430125F|nr:hypothetical protein [Massilia arenosa]
MTQAARATLSASDLALLADALACAAADFTDQSCNDFSVARSPENRAALEPVVAAQMAELGAQWTGAKNPANWLEGSSTRPDTYVIPDEWAAAFFAEKYASTPPATISAAEGLIVADLLDRLAELHAEWAEQDPATEPHPHAHRLAQRCRTLAAASEVVHLDAAVRAETQVSAAGIPLIERPGIAPRFPDLKKYLKDYTVNFRDWQFNELAFLQTYADRGPGFEYTSYDYEGADRYTYRNDGAVRDVDHCAMMLRWHAIQVALGAGVPKRAVSKGAAACAKRYEALRQRAPHIWSLGDDTETRDIKIAKFLMYDEAFTAADMEAAILASPSLADSEPEMRASYAAKVVSAAVNDPSTRCFIQMREREQDGLEAYRKEIGKDWTIPWTRSLAYHVQGARMAQHARGTLRADDLEHMVPTAVHCLLIGWRDKAREMHQYCHARLTADFADLSQKKYAPERRTQLFALRLLDQWFESGRDKYPPQAHSEPLFEALLAHWRHPDPEALAPLMLAACDRHTQVSMAKGSPDLERDEYWYDPYEIVLVLHLRKELGLANPALDHPIMNTPLGGLRTPAPAYREPLLDAVAARFVNEVA